MKCVDQQFNYDKHFTQLNTQGRAASNVIWKDNSHQNPQIVVYAGEDITIRADEIITWEANSVICGFALEQSYKEALKKRYTQQLFVIPVEVVRIYNFSTPPSRNGLNCVMTVPMVNVKEVCVLFPRYSSDLTVFFNPCLNNLQINMLNRQFPDQPADTTSAEFFRLQLENMNLDNIFPCTESLENSFTTIPTFEYPVRDRSKSDNTDFVLTIPTERSNANAFFFDGVFSRNETITLRGSPLSVPNQNGDMTIVDTYYVLNRNNDVPGVNNVQEINNKTAPILCLVSDSFFIFTSNRKAAYETTLTWNEAFAKNFPGIYQSLVSTITGT
jgi:hypothetical protein